MRIRTTILLCGALFLAGTASGATIDFAGTTVTALGSNPGFVTTATGVATITTGTGSRLTSIVMPPGFTGAQTVPLTDPNNSQLVTLINGASGAGGSLGNATSPIYGGKASGVIPINGASKLCIVLQGCGGGLDIPLTENGTRGIGIGGLITVSGYGPGTRISIQGGPWTVASAKLTNAFTTNAMIPGETRAPTRDITVTAFAHGPNSASSTGRIGGRLQYVNAQFVVTNLNSPTNLVELTLKTTLDFVPEPGLMLLLASGVAGLALLGRNQLRK